MTKYLWVLLAVALDISLAWAFTNAGVVAYNMVDPIGRIFWWVYVVSVAGLCCFLTWEAIKDLR